MRIVDLFETYVEATQLLQEWKEAIEHVMEEIDSRSVHNPSSNLTRDYQALYAVTIVIDNNLVALKNPKLLDNNIFVYDINVLYDEDEDEWSVKHAGACHASITNDIVEVKWIGSYNTLGKDLLRQVLTQAKAKGAKKAKLTAKWGSEGFYKKQGFRQVGDTRSNPIAGSDNTDFEKDL